MFSLLRNFIYPFIFIQMVFSPLAHLRAQVSQDEYQGVMDDAEHRKDQRQQEAGKLGDEGKDVLRTGFDEANNTLDFGYSQGAGIANQTITEGAMLLTVVIFFVLIKFIFGGLWTLFKIKSMTRMKAKCMLYPTDLLIVGAAATHAGLEYKAVKDLMKDVLPKIEKVKSELAGGTEGSDEGKKLQDVVNDPILDTLLISDPQWFKSLGDDMVGASPSSSSLMAPVEARKKNLQDTLDCMEKECAGKEDFTNPAKVARCRAVQPLKDQLKAMIAEMDKMRDQIWTTFKKAFDGMAGQIPDMSGKLKEVRGLVGQYEPKGLSLLRVYGIFVEILESFLGFEKDRHFAYQMAVTVWFMALVSAIAKKFITAGDINTCFSWTDVIKVAYLLLVNFMYVGYSKAAFTGKDSVPEKGMDQLASKDGWLEGDAKGVVDQIPGLKDVVKDLMAEYDKMYADLKSTLKNVRTDLNKSVPIDDSAAKSEEAAKLAKRQEIGTLIFGLIPFHDHRMGLLMGRIKALKALEEKVKSLYGNAVGFGGNVMNDLKEFREKIRVILGSDLENITLNYNKALNEVDGMGANLNTGLSTAGFSCQLKPGPPAPVLSPPPPASTSTSSQVNWPKGSVEGQMMAMAIKLNEKIEAKLEQIRSEQKWRNALFSLLGEEAWAGQGVLRPEEGASGGSCITGNLLPDPGCSCAKNGSCFQLDRSSLAGELVKLKSDKLLPQLDLANKILRGGEPTEEEKQKTVGAFQQVTAPKNLGPVFGAALEKLGIAEKNRTPNKEGFKKLGEELLKKVLTHGMDQYNHDESVRDYWKNSRFDGRSMAQEKINATMKDIAGLLKSKSSVSLDNPSMAIPIDSGVINKNSPRAHEVAMVNDGPEEKAPVEAPATTPAGNLGKVYKLKSIYQGEKSLWHIISQRYLNHYQSELR